MEITTKNVFHVGDIIKGTVDKQVIQAEVLEVYLDEERMLIKFLEHKDGWSVYDEEVVPNDAEWFCLMGKRKGINSRKPFEVGDIVKGKDNGYVYTGKDCLRAIVVRLNHWYMTLKILEHKDSSLIGFEYEVENNAKFYKYIEHNYNWKYNFK